MPHRVLHDVAPEEDHYLDWEEVTLDAAALGGTFRLNRHKNVNKGIKAPGRLAC